MPSAFKTRTWISPGAWSGTVVLVVLVEVVMVVATVVVARVVVVAGDAVVDDEALVRVVVGESLVDKADSPR